MITGSITARYEATIRLQVCDAGGQVTDVDAVIDTGFNGFLTLPAAIVQALGLPLQGTRDAMLADGTLVSLDIHRATVIWGGRPRSVQALAAGGGPLVGMSLLRGHAVLMHVVPGGPVTIHALP